MFKIFFLFQELIISNLPLAVMAKCDQSKALFFCSRIFLQRLRKSQVIIHASLFFFFKFQMNIQFQYGQDKAMRNSISSFKLLSSVLLMEDHRDQFKVRMEKKTDRGNWWVQHWRRSTEKYRKMYLHLNKCISNYIHSSWGFPWFQVW